MPIPLPVIAKTYRVALKWTTGSITAVNVIHVTTTAAAVPAADVFENLDDSVTQAMWGPVSGAAFVNQVDITPLDGASATSSFSTGAPARWSGPETGDLQIAPSAIVKFGTGLRGRNHRGRIYLPLLGEAATNGGALVGTRAADLTTAWIAFQVAINADATTPMTQVVAAYDRKHAGAGAVATAVSSYLGELELGTQRRRQGRLR